MKSLPKHKANSILKILFTLFFTILLYSSASYSQNYAPALSLGYTDYGDGDIIMTKVRACTPLAMYTYYCAMNWNAGANGGGYCGIQNHPDGHNFIFSLWDPEGYVNSIEAVYTKVGTTVEYFGNEGTGLKSWNFDLGWEVNQWYTLLARLWNSNGKTYFGFWVQKETTGKWYHLITMKYPIPDVKFSNYTLSFLEDWYGNGWDIRKINLKQGWKRQVSGNWYNFESAYFDRNENSTSIYLDNYDGNIENDYFYMQSGGSTLPSLGQEIWLTLNNPYNEPQFPSGAIDNYNIFYDYMTQQAVIYWDNDSTKLPHFSCCAEIYENPSYSGSPVIISQDTIPWKCLQKIDCNNLNEGKYYVLFYFSDLFDNSSDTIYGDFTKLENCFNPSSTDLYSYYRLDDNLNDFGNMKNHGVSYGNLNLNAADRFGNVTGAGYFDGLDDYILLDQHKFPCTYEYSICTWFKTTQQAYDRRIYRWRWYGNGIGLNNGHVFADFWSNSNYFRVQSPIIYSDNFWHLAVVTYDRNVLKLYIDTLLVDSIVANENVFYLYGGMAIGRDGDYNGLYYQGYLDDIRYYGYAIHPDEVQCIFNEQRITNVSGEVMLEGPYNSATKEMNTFLNPSFIPNSQPYNTAPWNYYGLENVLTFPLEVVDWILVELRETDEDITTATTDKIIARKAGFLLEDGTITNIDGQIPIQFNVSISSNLYCVIMHRNHLGIISALPLIELGGVYNYSFVSNESQTYGGINAVKELSQNTWGMITADGNADGLIDNIDLDNIWSLQAGEAGYQEGDFNMDSEVDNKDKDDIWVPNEGKGSQIPE